MSGVFYGPEGASQFPISSSTLEAWRQKVSDAFETSKAFTDQTIKQDADKLRWGLLFGPLQEALAEVVKVLAEGEKKYGQGNTWKDVTPQRYLEAASRHIMELHSKGVGHVNSQDGNVYHCAQAIIDLLFALQNTLAAEKVKEK